MLSIKQFSSIKIVFHYYNLQKTLMLFGWSSQTFWLLSIRIFSIDTGIVFGPNIKYIAFGKFIFLLYGNEWRLIQCCYGIRTDIQKVYGHTQYNYAESSMALFTRQLDATNISIYSIDFDFSPVLCKENIAVEIYYGRSIIDEFKKRKPKLPK